MSSRDVDLGVRVRAIQTITLIDKTGFLEDEEISNREDVSQLLFDKEIRIRRAAGDFVTGVWQERTEKLTTDAHTATENKKRRAKGVEDKLDEYLSYKALIGLLVETSDRARGIDVIEDGEPQLTLTGEAPQTRTMAAVESLNIDVFENWASLAEYLLIDHSGHEHDSWLLDEQEESWGLQLLCACVALEEVR